MKKEYIIGQEYPVVHNLKIIGKMKILSIGHNKKHDMMFVETEVTVDDGSVWVGEFSLNSIAWCFTEKDEFSLNLMDKAMRHDLFEEVKRHCVLALLFGSMLSFVINIYLSITTDNNYLFMMIGWVLLIISYLVRKFVHHKLTKD